MARITNFGKQFIQSTLFRYQHPLGPGVPAGASGSPPLNQFRMEALSFWYIYIAQAYFDHVNGIDPDHATLGAMHARNAGCVIGRNSHTSANPWFTNNRIPIGDTGFLAAPTVDNGTDTSTLPIPILSILWGANATYPQNNIGGIAITLANSAADVVEVVGIYDFSNGAVNVTGSGQTHTINNGTLLLSEA